VLIPLESIIRSFPIPRGPVLHVGAHLGEEAADYERFGFRPVWWVEANAELKAALFTHVRRFTDHHIIIAALADCEKDVTFHIANNGQSSSVFPLGTHATEHPEVHYVRDLELRTTTVDALFDAGRIGQAEFINLDIEGSELDVLKGAEAYLGGVSTIYSEVSDTHVRVGHALFPEVAEWLGARGFDMVAKRMTPHGWGDALWIRKS